MKKGISLITLIVTIVIMVIVAGAIIITINSTNTIGKSNEATFKQNAVNYEEELNNYIAEQTLSNNLYNAEELNLYGSDVKIAIPSMSDNDTQIFSVVNGKLVVNSDAKDDYKLWAEQVEIEVLGSQPVENGNVPSATTSPTSTATATIAVATGAIDEVSLADIKMAILSDNSPGYTNIRTGEGSPTNSSTMTRVAQAYYGKNVNYSSGGVNDWQLYYIGEEGSRENKEYHIYLISSNYVQHSLLPKTSNSVDMSKGNSEYRSYFNENSCKRDIDINNKMIARGYITLDDLSIFGLDTTKAEEGKYVEKEGGTVWSSTFRFYFTNKFPRFVIFAK